MSSRILKEVIQEIGLDQNSYLVFDDLIYYPDDTISTRSRRLKLDRKLIYLAIEKLEQSNLVMKSGKSWQISSMYNLLAQMQAKAQENLNLVSSFERLIPKLIFQLDTNKKEATVKYYEGKNQIIEMMEEHLYQAKDAIYSFGNLQLMLDRLGEKYFQNWVDRRVENNVKSKDIVSKINYYIKQKSWDKKLSREVKFLPDKVKVESLFSICGDKVEIWNPDNEKVISIKDGNVASLLLTMFEMVWISL